MAAQQTPNLKVGGSSPSWPANPSIHPPTLKLRWTLGMSGMYAMIESFLGLWCVLLENLK